ncbi:histidine biosynthesis protein [Burkholderia arboris]|uniref:Histidine biosynthesis protein n=1 Tax=Burkholderia arboris TaxID=488730 RepID=A0A9Q9SIA1_9BURK|nr:H-NS histone family protein [Burkholderia arboris]VWB63467.1 histidine biosynthesis protein [Burkholderia arboris]
MSRYRDLIEQRAELERQINAVKSSERAAVLDEVRRLVIEFEINAREIFGANKSKKGIKLTPKFRDPETGKTWCGRGRTPLWLKDKDPKNYLIAR